MSSRCWQTMHGHKCKQYNCRWSAVKRKSLRSAATSLNWSEIGELEDTLPEAVGEAEGDTLPQQVGEAADMRKKAGEVAEEEGMQREEQEEEGEALVQPARLDLPALLEHPANLEAPASPDPTDHLEKTARSVPGEAHAHPALLVLLDPPVIRVKRVLRVETVKMASLAEEEEELSPDRLDRPEMGDRPDHQEGMDLRVHREIREVALEAVAEIKGLAVAMEAVRGERPAEEEELLEGQAMEGPVFVVNTVGGAKGEPREEAANALDRFY